MAQSGQQYLTYHFDDVVVEPHLVRVLKRPGDDA